MDGEVEITKEQAKYFRDEFVLTPHENNLGKFVQHKATKEDKEAAIKLQGVSPENFDKIIKPTKEFKQAAQIFSGKIALAEEFIQKQPIFYDDAGIWWIWNTNTLSWKMVDEVTLMNLLYLSLNADTINSKERGEIIQALKQVGRLYRPIPLPVTWVQFKGKIVDIVTGEEKDASPEYFGTNPIPYELHKDKFLLTPVMDKIFEEWVGKDHVQTLYEIIAYCLIPDYPIHRLFCFIGAGLNGKSCYLRLIEKFVGKDNCCTTELERLLNSKFEAARLHKKLVCMMGETNFNEISKTSLLKQLTGQDLIPIEYKNKNLTNERNYAKILISTNNLPETTDKTTGFYRRWLIIDFPNQFNEAQDILGTIPEEEYESLALKSALTLHELLKRRSFTGEGSIEARQKSYEEKSNPFDKFFKDRIEEDSNCDIPKWEFEKVLNQWCVENKFRQLSSETIAKRMRDKGIQESRLWKDWFENGEAKKKQFRCWVGAKWKS